MHEEKPDGTAPPFPFLEIAQQGIRLIAGADDLKPANALGLIRNATRNARYFDKNGIEWSGEMSCRYFRPTRLNIFLAKTVHNPKLTAEWRWTPVGSYDITTLKEEIDHCIDADDDILTQFVEAEDLKGKLAPCRTFEDIVGMLSDYVFGPDEEKIYREFPPEE